MIHITNIKCNRIYDTLDTFKPATFVPVKHDVNDLIKLKDDDEITAAFLIYCSEYNEHDTKEIHKYINKQITVG